MRAMRGQAMSPNDRAAAARRREQRRSSLGMGRGRDRPARGATQRRRDGTVAYAWSVLDRGCTVVHRKSSQGLRVGSRSRSSSARSRPLSPVTSPMSPTARRHWTPSPGIPRNASRPMANRTADPTDLPVRPCAWMKPSPDAGDIDDWQVEMEGGRHSCAAVVRDGRPRVVPAARRSSARRIPEIVDGDARAQRTCLDGECSHGTDEALPRPLSVANAHHASGGVPAVGDVRWSFACTTCSKRRLRH